MRHMFILDTIREFNSFVATTMIQWYTSPDRTQETWDSIQGIIDRQRGIIMYTGFTEEEKYKYQSKIINNDDNIIAKVATM